VRQRDSETVRQRDSETARQRDPSWANNTFHVNANAIVGGRPGLIS
jgi:hypothetical protein